MQERKSAQNRVITIESESLHKEVQVGIVEPINVKETEKILLLLHGYDGTYEDLAEKTKPEKYAKKYKVLIVTPNMGNGYYISKENYNVNAFIACELLREIRRVYNLAEGVPVYLAGISMGGYGSLLIGAKYPECFKKIISFSGALIAHDVAIGNPQVVGDYKNEVLVKYFSDTFGEFYTLEMDSNRNPIQAIIKCEKKLPPIIMTCGSKDDLFLRNKRAVEEFKKNGIDVEWHPIYGMEHDFKCFQRSLTYFLKRI